MKKILFASAFALIGTFAMANETTTIKNDKVVKDKTEEVKKVEKKTYDIVCVPEKLSCTEDCLNIDTEIEYTQEQLDAEFDQIEQYNCGG